MLAGEYDKQLDLIPNLTLDGINDCGLICSHNVVSMEAKTGKDLVINTRRILYVKDIDKNTCLVMMNSGYKLKVRKELNKFFTQNLCVRKPIADTKKREPQRVIIVKK